MQHDTMNCLVPKEDPPKNFEQMSDECYICLEPCKRKSQCKCNTFVHKKCMQNYLKVGQIDQCKVCLHKYDKKDHNHCRVPFFKIARFFIIIITVYIAAGCIGELIYSIFTNQPVMIHKPWDIDYMLSATGIILVSFFMYSIIKRYRIYTI